MQLRPPTRRFARRDARVARLGRRRGARPRPPSAPRRGGPAMSPSMSATIRSSEPSFTSTTPTVSPSRRTVARSQTAAISIIRWEMKMTDRSDPRWPPMTSRTLSVRSAGRAAVISSSIRTSGSMASARARSMTRSVASGRSRARSDRSRSPMPELGQPVPERLDRGPRQAQVGGDVEVGDERRLLVDGDDAAAAGLGRGVGDVAARRGRGWCRCPGGRRRSGS